MKIAVIPARGGSKRIPRKNIRNFAGIPMIAHVIRIAHESQLFEKIIVSTDDEEIAAISRQWGADTPFKRPVQLADDFTGTTEVIAHATRWAIAQKWKLDAVCCLYATAPFIRIDDLVAGWEALSSGKWSYTFSVTEFPSPIFRAFQQTTKGGVEMFFPEYFEVRSQDLPLAFHDAGQFYWGTPDSWLEEKQVFGQWSTGIKLPRYRVVDIDTEEDWYRAELLWETIVKRKDRQ